jgi:hypothetical protein
VIVPLTIVGEEPDPLPVAVLVPDPVPVPLPPPVVVQVVPPLVQPAGGAWHLLVVLSQYHPP